jgi:hypothetical protein
VLLVNSVLRLPGPSPGTSTHDHRQCGRPSGAVAGDALRLALDEVAAVRDVAQRARNQHCDESSGRSAPPHAVKVARERGLIGAAAKW